MKTKLIPIGLLLLILSCNTQNKDDKVTGDTDENTETGSESSVVYDATEAIWGYEQNQQTGEYELVQLRPVDRNSLTGESLEKIINKSWPRIELKFIRTSNDTAFISIPDSRVMTQQIGSAGAMSFMSSTTFSFTELIGINHVSFDFEEGDHAMPGVYDRNSWEGQSGS